ncbi:hypothetical protein Pelsub_P0383 [Pelolinea submarina]|nr:hypothetical protein Pelsub_P0383 [Pelolinea submarina]
MYNLILGGKLSQNTQHRGKYENKVIRFNSGSVIWRIVGLPISSDLADTYGNCLANRHPRTHRGSNPGTYGNDCP